MLVSKEPDWLKESNIRTYDVQPYMLDYIDIDGHVKIKGYLLVLYVNTKIRQTHFFRSKRSATSYGKKYMKGD